MRSHITFLFLIFITASAFAQQTNRTFLGKKELNWLQTEVSQFESHLNTLSQAHNNEDNQVISQHKSRTIASINNLSSHSEKMLLTIQKFIDKDKDEIANPVVVDNIRNSTYERFIKKPAYEPLVLFDGDMKRLYESLTNMNDIQSQIKANNFDFFPSEKNSDSNINLSKKLLTLAKEFNSILQKSKV